jgi:CheY-like chemotaxis protein
VELHGGAVTVRNNYPDSGATFSVRLPKRAVAAIEHDPGAPSQEPPELPSLDGLTVVLVDGEPEERDLVGDVLRGRGAEVHSTTTAEEALKLVGRHTPDVVIAELGVTAGTGEPLIASLRSLSGGEGGAVITVALSSRASDRVASLLAGYQAHLCRPADPLELVAIVATLGEVSAVPVGV